MKTVLVLLASCVALNVYADNGGGTMSISSQEKEIVFNQGEDGENVNFKYAIQENGRWNVQDIRISRDQIAKDAKAMEALRESREKGQWALIRGN